MTTYGGVDVAPPELNSSVLWQYVRDVQFSLLVIAVAWTAWMWRFDRAGVGDRRSRSCRGNLAVNLIFFMTHPIFTPYYTIPVAMLSLWTLLFVTFELARRAGGGKVGLPQPVKT